MRFMLITTLTILLFLGSLLIYKRNIKTTPSDTFRSTNIFSADTGSYIINHELAFQSISFSLERGFKTNFYKNRLSVYSLNNGALISRNSDFEFDDRFEVLGVASGYLWIYSSEKNSHLMRMDPVSLKIKISHNNLWHKRI